MIERQTHHLCSVALDGNYPTALGQTPFQSRSLVLGEITPIDHELRRLMKSEENVRRKESVFRNAVEGLSVVSSLTVPVLRHMNSSPGRH
jgi:hypothetical protein